MIYVPKIKVLDTPGTDTSTFEQMNGVYLKDAWFKIKEMHYIEPI
jgi:hypothetical protein